MSAIVNSAMGHGESEWTLGPGESLAVLWHTYCVCECVCVIFCHNNPPAHQFCAPSCCLYKHRPRWLAPWPPLRECVYVCVCVCVSALVCKRKCQVSRGLRVALVTLQGAGLTVCVDSNDEVVPHGLGLAQLVRVSIVNHVIAGGGGGTTQRTQSIGETHHINCWQDTTAPQWQGSGAFERWKKTYMCLKCHPHVVSIN